MQDRLDKVTGVTVNINRDKIVIEDLFLIVAYI